MKIYTKLGDLGSTSLIGEKNISKNDIRVQAYGSIDELNSHIGLLLAYLNQEKQLFTDSFCEHIAYLKKIQNSLFILGCELSTSSKNKKEIQIDKINTKDIQEVETSIDNMQNLLATLTYFILPGGSIPSAQAHVVRSVTRRVERNIVEMHQIEPLRDIILGYINRLSDFFFTCARYYNFLLGQQEHKWEK